MSGSVGGIHLNMSGDDTVPQALEVEAGTSTCMHEGRSSTTILGEPERWDGTSTMYKLWWVRMRIWAMLALKKGMSNEEVCQTVIGKLVGEAEGFAISVYNMTELLGWPT